MNDRGRPSELEDLKGRIEKARPKEEEVSDKKAPDPMRIGLELVSGVCVGGLLGYYLDKWLGTTPLFLITLFLLGAAAGFRNIYRLVGTDTDRAEEETKNKN